MWNIYLAIIITTIIFFCAVFFLQFCPVDIILFQIFNRIVVQHISFVKMFNGVYNES